MKRGLLLLACLGLLAYWPVLDSHPLMDDHLFFAWLEQTPWLKALQQRLTGNWIPYFNQLQMYRPVSGVVQASTYQLFGAHRLPQHLFSFLLHIVASLLTGILAFRLSRDSRAGWCAGGILLLHPRAAFGVSLIFNFYDALAACLMLGSLLCLWSLQQPTRSGWSYSKLGGLWVCAGLAYGVKELALPFVGILILADWLWNENESDLRQLLVRQIVPVLLLCFYLFARTKAVGHPFRTHHHPSAFPLPAHADEWALSWDFLLLVACGVVAVYIRQALKRRWDLPNHAPWVVLWVGLAFLPAIHFCSQITLRPWLFDERYWYVPLAPLSVLAGLCLTRGGWLSAGLGAAILGFTLPGWLGWLLAALTLVVVGPLQLRRLHLETQRMAAVLFAAALSLATLKQCQVIRLRADEAAAVHQAVATAVTHAPAASQLAFLNFNETSVEHKGSFNGDLQWLLQPPFFKEDLNRRLFFSYSRWDEPPSNRFRDWTTTEGLMPNMRTGPPISVFRWSEGSRTLDFLGEDSWPREGSATHIPIEVVRNGSPLQGRRIWEAENLAIDPKTYRYISITVTLPGRSESERTLALCWRSVRSRQFEEVRLAWPLSEEHSTGKATVWLYPGRYVDWVLSEAINELVFEMSQELEVVTVEVSSNLPAEVAKRGRHINHYRNPAMKFEWMGESWWVSDTDAAKDQPQATVRRPA